MLEEWIKRSSQRNLADWHNLDIDKGVICALGWFVLVEMIWRFRFTSFELVLLTLQQNKFTETHKTCLLRRMQRSSMGVLPSEEGCHLLVSCCHP